jgi:hypothetical protein
MVVPGFAGSDTITDPPNESYKVAFTGVTDELLLQACSANIALTESAINVDVFSSFFMFF